MLEKMRGVIRLAFTAAPDMSTAAGRSRDRYRRAALTTLMAVIARTVNVGTGIATIPLAVSYLGKDQFGLWMTLTSFVTLMVVSDLGMGIGLQNALTVCHARNDRKTPKELVSSALLVMLVMVGVLTVVALFVLPHIPLERLIKTETAGAGKELLPASQTVLIVFGIALPAKLVQRTYNAYQRGYWANGCLAVGRALGFAGVVASIQMGRDLPWLIASMMGLPFIVLLAAGVRLSIKQPWLSPSVRAVRKRALCEVGTIGVTAVFAHLGFLALASGAQIIIANRISSAAVTPYATTHRLLSVGFIMLVMMWSSLWPAYGEAGARGDVGWIRRTFRRSVLIGYAVQVPTCIVVLLFGQRIITWWAGKPARPDGALLVAVNIQFVLMVWWRCAMITLKGLNRMKGLAAYGLFFTATGMVAGFFWGDVSGPAGVVYGVTLAGILPFGVAMLVDIGRLVGWFGRARLEPSSDRDPEKSNMDARASQEA